MKINDELILSQKNITISCDNDVCISCNTNNNKTYVKELDTVLIEIENKIIARIVDDEFIYIGNQIISKKQAIILAKKLLKLLS